MPIVYDPILWELESDLAPWPSWGWLTNPVAEIQFQTAQAWPTQEWGLAWNTNDWFLEVWMPWGKTKVSVGWELLVPRRCINNTASDTPNGRVVYISGVQGNTPVCADASAAGELTSSKTIWIYTENVLRWHKGWVTAEWIVRWINTALYMEGTALWLSATPGQFTDIKPVAPHHLVYVGTVLRQHATEGEIMVKIQNGYELEELHNVVIQDAAPWQVLQYDGSVWRNVTMAIAWAVLLYASVLAAAPTSVEAYFPTEQVSHYDPVDSASPTVIEARYPAEQVSYYDPVTESTPSSITAYVPAEQQSVYWDVLPLNP